MSYNRSSLLKKMFYLSPFLLAYSTLMALPEGGEVVMGEVEFHSSEPHLLQIKTSDKAILNYQSFNIAENEHVRFIQPSSKSTVLTRVKEGDPSKIFGQLSANGRVFLLNPSGIYFGPNSSVNAGSFLASTLNIRDEDFLNERFSFSLQTGFEQSKIINEGTISASQDGFVAFFAPSIENRGSIFAKAGKVMLASAETVMLDFSGDGLMQFVIDGDLKQTIVENYEHIQSGDGSVGLSLKSAKDMMEMLINTDELMTANDIQISNGTIRLVNRSRITASNVQIEGSSLSYIDVQGTIDASNPKEGESGGKIQISGGRIELASATIDVSGHAEGGVVLIGGNYQGKGELRTSRHTSMDKDSQIYADAYEEGDGGKVILWADDTTFFNGKIFARGNGESGVGGFVETSGKNVLSVQDGVVDTSAPSGKYGNWLLDPNTITIAIGGGGSLSQASNCSSSPGITISPAMIASSTTNVTLCAQKTVESSITVVNAITITNPNVSLSLMAGSTGLGAINLNNNLTTAGSAIHLTGSVNLGINVSLDTTYAGKVPTGGDISFSNTVDGARILTLNSGTMGVVTLGGSVGSLTPLTSFTALAATINQRSTVQTVGALTYTAASEIGVSGNVTTSSGAIYMRGPVVLANNPTFDSTNAGASPKGASIRFASSVDGATLLTLQAGSNGNVVFTGAVGEINPLINLAFASANIIQIGSDITITGISPLIFQAPVNLIGSSHITSNHANIVFDSTIDGDKDLRITGENIVFAGTIGEGTSLSSLIVTANAITQNSTAQIAGPLSFAATNAITIHGNITTSNGTIDMTGPVILASNLVFDSTNGGTLSGATLRFSGTLDGANSLMLAAGTSGDIYFSAVVGGTNPLNDLFFVSANTIQFGNDLTVTGANPLIFPSPVHLIGKAHIRSGDANVSFNSTLDGEHAFTLSAGTASAMFLESIGQTTPLTGLTVTAASTINGNITTKGGSVTLTGPVIFSTSSMIDTTNDGDISTGADIVFSGTLNGSSELVLRAGSSGNISFMESIGESIALTNLTAIASAITQNSKAQITGFLSYTAPTAISIRGDITTNAEAISILGPVKITNSPIFDTTSHGALKGADITFSATIDGATTLTLQAGKVGNISFAGAIGKETAPTNLIATGSMITQSSMVQLVGFLNYEAEKIKINADIITNRGSINMIGAVTLLAASLLDTTNGGTNPLGADVYFSNAIDGDQSLTLLGGEGRAIFTGAVGEAIALANLTVDAATITQGSNLRVVDFLNYKSKNETNIYGNITTSGGAVHVTGPVTLEVASVIDTTNAGKSPNGADIIFLKEIDGNQDLMLIGGSGGFISLAKLGSSHALDSVIVKAQTIEIRGDITTNGGIIDVIGSTLLVNNLTFDSTNKGSFSGANIHFSDAINGCSAVTVFSGTGMVTFDGSVGASTALSNLTVVSGSIVQGATLQVENFLNYTASKEITINGTILTNAGPIHMTGPVVFSATSTIDTTNVGKSPTGADIAFSRDINGNQTLLLIGGSDGSISLTTAGSVTPLQSLIATGKSINVNGNISTTGNIYMIGEVLLANNPVFDSTAGSLDGANIRFTDAIDGATNLTIQAGKSGNIIFAGALGGITPLADLCFTSANTIFVGSNITVTGSNPLILSEPVVLMGSSHITSNNADIIFKSSLDGNESLTLLAGQGKVIFEEQVGTNINLRNLTVKANSITQGSTTQLSDFLKYAATEETNINGNITTNAGSVYMTGPVVLMAAATIDTTNAGTCPSGADIVFSKMINGDQSFTLIGGNNGFISLPEIGDITALSTFIATGRSIEINGNITTRGGSIDLIGSVILSADSTIDATNQGKVPLGANILFAGSVDGPKNLTLQAGSLGNLNFMNAVGALTRIGDLTIETVNSLSATSLTARSILMNSSIGTAIFNGDLNTSGAAGIQLTGTMIHQLGGVVTQNKGSYTVSNEGTLTLKATAINSISGSYIQNGNGPVYCEGNLSTVTGNILFSSPVTLLGNLTLNTESSGGDITFLNTVDGTQDLTLIARTGHIHLNENLGEKIPLGAFTIDSASGIYALKSVRAGSINVGALGDSSIDFKGSLFTDKAGINVYAPLNFVGDSSFDTTLSSKDMHFFAAIDGAFNSTFTAGTGNILFDANVGEVTPLSGFTLRSAQNVTASGSISAQSIAQLAGSGKATYAKDLFTSSPEGISLEGSEFELRGTITTANGGPLLIKNASILTLSKGGMIAGGLIQTGAGSSLLSGSIIAGAPISFASPVALRGNTNLDTSTSQSNMTFLNTVDGPYDLTLNLGDEGDLTLNGTLGDASRLGSMIITKVRNVLASNVTAASITQTSGSGITKLKNVNTDHVLGVSLSGNSFSIEGDLITTNLGSVVLDHSGPLVLRMGQNTSITGTFKQRGEGPVALAGNLMTLDKDLLFAKPVSLIGPTSLSTGKGVGTITFSGTLDLTGFMVEH